MMATEMLPCHRSRYFFLSLISSVAVSIAYYACFYCRYYEINEKGNRKRTEKKANGKMLSMMIMNKNTRTRKIERMLESDADK